MRLSPELRDRTKAYASAVIRFYVDLPRSRKEVEVIGNQLLRSGTSVAAHTREASRARSSAEFCSKLDVLLQEADEPERSGDRQPFRVPLGRRRNQVELWLKLLRDDCFIVSDQLPWLLAESHEIIAIFTTIVSKVRRQ